MSPRSNQTTPSHKDLNVEKICLRASIHKLRSTQTKTAALNTRLFVCLCLSLDIKEKSTCLQAFCASFTASTNDKLLFIFSLFFRLFYIFLLWSQKKKEKRQKIKKLFFMKMCQRARENGEFDGKVFFISLCRPSVEWLMCARKTKRNE